MDATAIGGLGQVILPPWPGIASGGAQVSHGGKIIVQEWPPVTAQSTTRQHIAKLEAQHGYVRNDILIEEVDGGKLIGQSGATFKELKSVTQCNIFVLLKEGAPPGYPANMRMVILVGTEEQVQLATSQCVALISAPKHSNRFDALSVEASNPYAPWSTTGGGEVARAASGGQIIYAEWPPASSSSATHIRKLEMDTRYVRHDMLIEEVDGGKLIGQGGVTYKELKTITGCNIFVLLKEGPPPVAGVSSSQRMVMCIGTEEQVACAASQVQQLVAAPRHSNPLFSAIPAAPMGGVPTGEATIVPEQQTTIPEQQRVDPYAGLAGLDASGQVTLGGMGDMTQALQLQGLLAQAQLPQQQAALLQLVQLQQSQAALLQAVPALGLLTGGGLAAFGAHAGLAGLGAGLGAAGGGPAGLAGLASLSSLSGFGGLAGAAPATGCPAPANPTGCNPVGSATFPTTLSSSSKSATAATGGQIIYADWPPPVAGSSTHTHLRRMERDAGHVRHDFLIDEGEGGKLIGQGGCTYKELKQTSGCNIFVLLKEGAPPGFAPTQRLVILIGTEQQVAVAAQKISALLSMTDTRDDRISVGQSAYNGPLSFRAPGSHDYSGVGAGPPPFMDKMAMYEQAAAAASQMQAADDAASQDLAIYPVAGLKRTFNQTQS
eukprot:CAMPEP_0119299956 /NCGR_PEP_ID=MMETSP1333-20130426/1971_1 /TAXON_ID=418940 /ORGANISM="Scyphosphaera apsteinii, Strain RCC1455" /LENGTH=660 /DNA_ID=CAMNT_0007301565 /DNA_START=15 /DNA_END=1997 /DNA_ORIENTATION=-